MNYEFTNEGNAPAVIIEEVNDPLSLSRAKLHSSNQDATCRVEMCKDVIAFPSDKLFAQKFSNKLYVVPERDINDSSSSLTTASGFDELATETHKPTLPDSCHTISEISFKRMDSASSFDPSSGSFYCDDTEQVIRHDTPGDFDTPSDYIESQPVSPLRRYEPTLEDLMTIMEFDEPNAHDDSPTKETFELIESAFAMTQAEDTIPLKREMHESSSEFFPNSSLDFGTNMSGGCNSKSKQDMMSSMSKEFFDDQPPLTKGRKQEGLSRKKEVGGKCSPNRPHPALEYPLLYFLLRRWSWLFEKIKIPYAYRWRMSYPLQKNVPFGNRIQKMGIYSTWGELLILLPFFLGIVFCLIYTLAFPSVSITGKIARYGLISSFVFAQRNSLVTLLIGMPFDRGLFYHKLSGRVAGAAGVLHTIAFYVDPVYLGKHKHDFCGGAFTGSVNISGSVMMLIVFGIFITAMARVRQRVYEVFYYLHVMFSAGIITCAFFHSGILVPILGALTWGVDLFIRSIVMARTRYPQKATLKVVSDTVVEVSFPKTAAFAYNPGQYVYLAIPEISWLQWHPFSISSSPKQRVVTLHIRKVGNWTKELFELSKKKSNVGILLEGPYGNLSIDLMNDRKYENVLLISGGIGITPVQSICEQLLYEKVKNRRKLNRLKFVWIERDPVLMQESTFVRRSSSVGSMGSMDFEDYLSSNASRSFSLDDILIDEQSTSPIDFDSALDLYAASLDHQVSKQHILDGDYCVDIIEQLLSVLPPGSSTDQELDAMYQSAEFALNDEDVPFGSSDKHERDASLIHNTGCKQKRPSFVLEEETSFAENDQCWLTEAAKIHENLFRLFDMQIYLTGKSPGANQIPYARYGRPDIKKIFLEMKADAMSSQNRRVAVCVSAPKSLTSLCRKACNFFSDDQVQFDFHSEIMSF